MNTEIKERIVQIQNGEIPEGYKMSKEGTIPSEWEIKKMGKIFTRVTRKNAENNQNNLTISALEGLVSQEEYFNKQIASKDNTGYYLLKKGEFAYNKSYSNGYPMGAIKRLDQYDKGVVSTLYICFAIKDKSDSDFFTHYFENGNLNREIYKIAQEGARNHGLLNMSVSEFFSDMQLVLPTKKERDKITTILSIQDKIIELKEKLLAEKKRQKEYLMQVLLNPDNPHFKRLPGFSGEWEKVRLGDIINLTIDNRGKTPPISDNGIELLETNAIKNIYSSPDYSAVTKYISDETYKSWFRQHVRKNDILISTVGQVGETAILKEDRGAIAQNLVGFRIKEEINPLFVYFTMNTSNFLSEIIAITMGAVQPSIKVPHIKSIKIYVPVNQDEQKRIADIILNVEFSMQIIQQEIEQQKNKKKALMQLLLTGKVRVKA